MHVYATVKLKLLKALSSQTRLKIVEILLNEKELCICNLTSKLNKDISTISRHVETLRDANIIVTNRKGKEIHVSLANPKEIKLFFENLKKLEVKL